MRRLYLFFLFLGFMVSNTTGCSCDNGCAFGKPAKTSCAPDFSHLDFGTGGGPFGTGGSSGSSGSCLPGQACGDNGVCSDNNVCCTVVLCAGACCNGGEICAFDHCVSPGKTCQTSSDCPDGSGCDYTLGGLASPPDPGVCAPTPQTGVCLPRPPDCTNGEVESSSCLPVCLAPPLAPFAPPTTLGSFGDAAADGDHVASLPVVLPLLDESCDGRIDDLDVPVIVFTTFSASNPAIGAVAHAMVMKDGALVPRWTSGPDPVSPTDPASALAAGNIDGSKGNEVVFCTLDHRVHALRADGSELWLSDPSAACKAPAIADLDGDGQVEIVTESSILDGKTGALLHTLTPASDAPVVIANLGGSPGALLSIVSGSRVYDQSGKVVADRGVASGFVAVGDLDGDGLVEIVATSGVVGEHALTVWRLDAASPGGFNVVRDALDLDGPLGDSCAPGAPATVEGGGPPLIADLDGDGLLDVAVASGHGILAFKGSALVKAAVPSEETILWASDAATCTARRAGLSAFDFDGDGKSEVLIADETSFRVLAGGTGAELTTLCNTSAPGLSFPIVADVDGDDRADILITANAHTGLTCNGQKNAGVRVLGAPSYARTGRIWNEHGYHGINVLADGRIPAFEGKLLHGFREAKENSNSPDLVITLVASCSDPFAFVVDVRNVGQARAPAGVLVVLTGGVDGTTALGKGATTKALAPGEAESVKISVDPAAEKVNVQATLGGAGSPAQLDECREDNNHALQSPGCEL
ncbi:MAG: VCBS repeat-containing protein [Byssovorax sp.]